MAKKKKNTLNIHDFFGTYNAYRIFALKSDSSVFPFANQLGQAIQTTFTILPCFEYNSDKYFALFTVFYAEYSQQDSFHCLLVENKAVISNQQELFISKAEEKLSFQTLSLFEEFLYLFNKQGFRCFDTDFEDIDYLLLLFAKKNIENEMFSQFLKKIETFKVKDVSYLLEKNQTSNETKIVVFLKDFFCKYEVRSHQFLRKKEKDLLAPITQLPRQNLQYPIPILLENNALADNLQLSSEYLRFLEEEE